MIPAYSTCTGKRIRLERLIDPVTGSCLVVALDHGVTSPRFLPGLYDTGRRIDEAIDGGATALMLTRGIARAYCDHYAGRAGLALMLTASAAGRPAGPQVTPIGSVDEALRIGADAVVVYVALGGENEPAMIRYLSDVGEACEFLGMPLIAEAEFPDAYETAEDTGRPADVEYLRRNARLCAEMGADIVKVNWSGDGSSFASIVRACGRPVILAGGPVLASEELISRMQSACDAGAIGCSVGRNVFEHADPKAMMQAISDVFKKPHDQQIAQQAVISAEFPH